MSKESLSSLSDDSDDAPNMAVSTFRPQNSAAGASNSSNGATAIATQQSQSSRTDYAILTSPPKMPATFFQGQAPAFDPAAMGTVPLVNYGQMQSSRHTTQYVGIPLPVAVPVVAIPPMGMSPFYFSQQQQHHHQPSGQNLAGNAPTAPSSGVQRTSPHTSPNARSGSVHTPSTSSLGDRRASVPLRSNSGDRSQPTSPLDSAARMSMQSLNVSRQTSPRTPSRQSAQAMAREMHTDVSVSMLLNPQERSPYRSNEPSSASSSARGPSPIVSPKPIKHGSRSSVLDAHDTSPHGSPQRAGSQESQKMFFPPLTAEQLAPPEESDLSRGAAMFPSHMSRPSLPPSHGLDFGFPLDRRGLLGLGSVASPAPSSTTSAPSRSLYAESATDGDSLTKGNAFAFGMKLRAKWERKVRPKGKGSVRSASSVGSMPWRAADLDSVGERPAKSARKENSSAAPLPLLRTKDLDKYSDSTSWSARSAPPSVESFGNSARRKASQDAETRSTFILPLPPLLRSIPKKREIEPEPEDENGGSSSDAPRDSLTPPSVPNRSNSLTPPSLYATNIDDGSTLYSTTPPDSMNVSPTVYTSNTLRWLENSGLQSPTTLEAKSRMDTDSGMLPRGKDIKATRLPSFAENFGSFNDVLWETGSNTSHASRTSTPRTGLGGPDPIPPATRDRFTLPPPPPPRMANRYSGAGSDTLSPYITPTEQLWMTKSAAGNNLYLTGPWTGDPSKLGTPETMTYNSF